MRGLGKVFKREFPIDWQLDTATLKLGMHPKFKKASTTKGRQDWNWPRGRLKTVQQRGTPLLFQKEKRPMPYGGESVGRQENRYHGGYGRSAYELNTANGV